MNSIKVKVGVINRGKRKGRGKKGLYFRWTDQTGRPCEEAIKDEKNNPVTKLSVAWQMASDKEDDLLRLLAGDGSILWQEWRDIVEDHYYPSLAENSVRSTDGILNCVERTIRPTQLNDITTQAMTKHASAYRRLGRSENTIASHFAAIRAVLNWSIEQGYLSTLPRFPRVPRATGTKSRGGPITDEQFEAVLAAVSRVVPASAVDTWRHFLRGLWLSGLRLSEAIKITWEPTDAGIWIDLSNPQKPKLAILSKAEKGKRNRLLPITPDFADFIRDDCPDRTGSVFKPLVRYDRRTSSRDQCTHIISAIGKASGVITEFGRHVTAHDLRRSFGLRWAILGTPPALLQQLMRHASIQTTMEYYARTDADRWGDELCKIWEENNYRVNRKVNQKNRVPQKQRK